MQDNNATLAVLTDALYASVEIVCRRMAYYTGTKKLTTGGLQTATPCLEFASEWMIDMIL